MARSTRWLPQGGVVRFLRGVGSYNLMSVIKAAFHSHGEQVVEEEVSEYHLANEVTRTHDEMMIAIPEDEWWSSTKTPAEMARCWPGPQRRVSYPTAHPKPTKTNTNQHYTQDIKAQRHKMTPSPMNYASLGDRLKSSAAENFPIFLADLCTRADQAYLTPSTRALLERREQSEFMSPSSRAILDYATHRLLWSWYRRDSEAQGREPDQDGEGPDQGSS